MNAADLASQWPGAPIFSVGRIVDGAWTTVLSQGDLSEVRPWASVSKIVVGLAAGIEFDEGRRHPDDRAGPPGATVAHLLSHASGLGFEEADRARDVGTRRVYSNYGIDLAAQACSPGPVAPWLTRRVFEPLAMHTSQLRGRPCADVWGSTADMAKLATQWLAPTVWSRGQRDRSVTPFLPALAGIVPGFGRFDPCPWGLGPELRGTKQHWMGDWPESSYGHFGQSGSLLLLDPTSDLALVATSSVPFGAWAVELWPQWVTAVRNAALSS